MSGGDHLYKRGNITVTRALVKVGNPSYPVNGISKVSIEIGKAPIGLAVFSGFVFIFGVAAGSSFLMGVGGFLGLLWLAAHYGRQSSIVIGTNGGDKSILTAPRSEKFVLDFKEAIEKAVSIRG